MNLYQIDDGELHWVSAESEEAALKVFATQCKEWCLNDYEVNEHLEFATIHQLTDSDGDRIDYYADTTRVSSMWQEFERDQSERYIACSEWL